MWQFAGYVLIFFVIFIILRSKNYNIWATLLNASVVSLIFLVFSSNLSPKDIISGNEEVAVVYILIILTLLYVVGYALYMANTYNEILD